MPNRDTKQDGFASLDSLIKPRYILRLCTLSGSQKIKYFESISQVWNTIYTLPPDSQEYKQAYGKLIQVSITAKEMHATELAQGSSSADTKTENRNQECGVCANTLDSSQHEDPRVSRMFPNRLAECGYYVCHYCAHAWFRGHSNCPTCHVRVEIGAGASGRIGLEMRQQIVTNTEPLAILDIMLCD